MDELLGAEADPEMEAELTRAGRGLKAGLGKRGVGPPLRAPAVEARALGPAQVHTEEHLGPVLRLGPAGAGVEHGDGVVVVELAAEQRRELELPQVRLEPAHRARELGLHLRVGLRRQELVHRSGVLEPPPEGVEPLELRAEARELRRQPLAARRVVPERGVRELRFARVWGKSAGFDGQQVSADHVVEDRDVVELHW